MARTGNGQADTQETERPAVDSLGRPRCPDCRRLIKPGKPCKQCENLQEAAKLTKAQRQKRWQVKHELREAIRESRKRAETLSLKAQLAAAKREEEAAEIALRTARGLDYRGRVVMKVRPVDAWRERWFQMTGNRPK